MFASMSYTDTTDGKELNNLIRQGWDWYKTTGDSHWLRYFLRRPKEKKKVDKKKNYRFLKPE